MERIPNIPDTCGNSSVFNLATRRRPPVIPATFSTSGATIRHGPHQGAQKSTSTGTDELLIIAWKTGELPTSTGEPRAGSAALQLAHWPPSPRRRYGIRFA